MDINNLKARPIFPCMYDGNLPADVEQAYDEALITLQTKAWVYYSILLNTRVHWSDKLATAGTDGAHVYINPRFFMGLDNHSQRAFLLAHEVGHIILRHPQRGAFYRKRGFHSMQGTKRIAWDARQYNVDADKVINADLIAHGLEFIPCGILDEAVDREALVDEVYVDSMLARPDEPETDDEPEQGDDESGESGDDEQSGESGDSESDDEQDGDDAESGESGDDADDGDDEQAGGSAGGESDDDAGDESGAASGSGHSDMDEHFEPQYDGTEDEQREAAEHDKAEIERAIDDALDALDDDNVPTGEQVSPTGATVDAGYRHSGKGTASDVNWQAELADLVTRSGTDGDITWSRLHRRRYATLGIVAPTRLSTMDQMVITVDMSGSVSRTQLQAFLIECAQLIDTLTPTSGCIVLWTNTRVTRVDEVFTGQELLDLTVPSGGGTKMSAAVDWLEQNGIVPDVHLCFTDGYFWGDEWTKLAAADVIVVLDRHPSGSVSNGIRSSGIRSVVAAPQQLAA